MGIGVDSAAEFIRRHVLSLDENQVLQNLKRVPERWLSHLVSLQNMSKLDFRVSSEVTDNSCCDDSHLMVILVY